MGDTLSCDTNSTILQIPDAQLYISFNYTDTLERVYGIPDNKILYFHGKASRSDNLIYGHDKSHFQIQEDCQKKYGLKESNSFFDPGTFGDEEFQLTMYISFLQKHPYTQIVKYNDILLSAVKQSK